ncbi:CopG family ribbon-helix-helix protein [Thermoproteus tenax]|uniref:Transcriptional regulator, CopG/MetJ family, putative nickel responsive regulator n=1 Tax=Thermoproteus tenax (strain ATCC 35583 / DSM 2078 / JCM 9277 / NBRC 100435 / Kra 1) TaxID=768679 RepID=G4RMT3_THETK|nr:CopG family ribbon-helix-helix protein [Thermoproteus tenax]CCC80877.1 Transcriptional regulator, CopG/MetJ family, putative nickel responsive regulator [Thermoproteus tenax Kra 1]
MRRISIALDDRLYRDMEKAMALMGEVNRSRFIASLIAEKISEVVQAPLASVIVIVYDHEVGEVSKSLTEVQHDFRDVIRASTHVHLDERNCLEVIHAVGDSARIRELVTRISRIGRGLKLLRIVNVPSLQ